jgi:hypothetical protein
MSPLGFLASWMPSLGEGSGIMVVCLAMLEDLARLPHVLLTLGIRHGATFGFCLIFVLSMFSF